MIIQTLKSKSTVYVSHQPVLADTPPTERAYQYLQDKWTASAIGPSTITDFTYPQAFGPGLSTLINTLGCPSGPPPCDRHKLLYLGTRAVKTLTAIARSDSLLYEPDGLF